jgi:hypothetical protein
MVPGATGVFLVPKAALGQTAPERLPPQPLMVLVREKDAGLAKSIHY